MAGSVGTRKIRSFWPGGSDEMRLIRDHHPSRTSHLGYAARALVSVESWIKVVETANCGAVCFILLDNKVNSY